MRGPEEEEQYSEGDSGDMFGLGRAPEKMQKAGDDEDTGDESDDDMDEGDDEGADGGDDADAEKDYSDDTDDQG